VHSIGIHLGVNAACVELTDPDPPLVADIWAIVCKAQDTLLWAGFRAVVVSPTSILFLDKLPRNARAALRARRSALARAEDLWRRLEVRPTRDPRVDVVLTVNVDRTDRLLELSDWIEPLGRSGVHVRDPILTGLAPAPPPFPVTITR
jgi:hypothetical protein